MGGIGQLFLSVLVQPYLNLKRDYCCVLDPTKELYLTFMILQESIASFLLDSELNLAISMNTNLGTTFYVEAHSAHAKQVLKIMITSSCTAHAFLSIEEISSRSIDFDIMRLSSKELTTLYLYGHPNLSTITNRIIIEGTLRFIKSTG